MPEYPQDSLDELFGALGQRLRSRTRQALDPLGVTPGQARALSQLAHAERLRPGALAERLRIAARSGTEVIDALEERGLAHRSPDPDDRRATLVTLTPEGERMAAEVRAARRSAATEFFDALEPADRADLRDLLLRLREATAD